MRRKGWVVHVVVFGFDETKPKTRHHHQIATARDRVIGVTL
jgi:hypothetical protein